MQNLCETCARPRDIAGYDMCDRFIAREEVNECDEYESMCRSLRKERVFRFIAKQLLECLNAEIKINGDAAERTLETIDRAIDILYQGESNENN